MTELLVALVGAGGAVVSALVANKARKNTKPISNGFAADVTARLANIEALITHHIQEHADAELRKGKP